MRLHGCQKHQNKPAGLLNKNIPASGGLLLLPWVLSGSKNKYACFATLSAMQVPEYVELHLSAKVPAKLVLDFGALLVSQHKGPQHQAPHIH